MHCDDGARRQKGIDQVCLSHEADHRIRAFLPQYPPESVAPLNEAAQPAPDRLSVDRQIERYQLACEWVAELLLEHDQHDFSLEIAGQIGKDLFAPSIGYMRDDQHDLHRGIVWYGLAARG